MHTTSTQPLVWFVTSGRHPIFTQLCQCFLSTAIFLQDLQQMEFSFSSERTHTVTPSERVQSNDALQTSSPIAEHNIPMSINRVRVCVPHFWSSGKPLGSLKAKHKRNIFVSSEQILTAECPAAYAAWSRSRLSAYFCQPISFRTSS